MNGRLLSSARSMVCYWEQMSFQRHLYDFLSIAGMEAKSVSMQRCSSLVLFSLFEHVAPNCPTYSTSQETYLHLVIHIWREGKAGGVKNAIQSTKLDSASRFRIIPKVSNSESCQSIRHLFQLSSGVIPFREESVDIVPTSYSERKILAN